MSQNKNLQHTSRYCYFDVNKEVVIDYKNTEILKRYTSSFGKIVPSKRSGVCSTHQRQLATAIKRARFMGLLPYLVK